MEHVSTWWTLAEGGRVTLALGPADVKPDYGYFPFITPLVDIAGGVAGAVLIVMVLLIIVGAALVIGGKMGSSNQAQRVGWGVLIAAVLGAAVVGSAGGIVDWASQIQLMAS